MGLEGWSTYNSNPVAIIQFFARGCSSHSSPPVRNCVGQHGVFKAELSVLGLGHPRGTQSTNLCTVGVGCMGSTGGDRGGAQQVSQPCRQCVCYHQARRCVAGRTYMPRCRSLQVPRSPPCGCHVLASSSAGCLTDCCRNDYCCPLFAALAVSRFTNLSLSKQHRSLSKQLTCTHTHRRTSRSTRSS